MPSSRLLCVGGRPGDRGDERLERVGIDGAARDELRDQRNAAAAGALERERRVLPDERLDAEPDHLRQVVIGGILAVRHQLARRCAQRAAWSRRCSADAR